MFTSGFIGSHILNFERSLSLAPGLQNSLVPACKIFLGGPVCGHCVHDLFVEYPIPGTPTIERPESQITFGKQANQSVHTQGLQEIFCKPEQDCFGAPAPD
jgi:hypothetical protein